MDPPAICPLVLDTNIVLDLLVFGDPAVRSLRVALDDGHAHWLVTADMRSELARVLAYPQLAARLPAGSGAAGGVLAQFDRLSRQVAAAPPAAVRCGDRDDQIFVDLAVAHRALLLSKDRQVLRLCGRLAALGVAVRAPPWTAGPASHTRRAVSDRLPQPRELR